MTTPQHDQDDAALKAALRGLPAAADSTALQRRVLDGWRAQRPADGVARIGRALAWMDGRMRLAGAGLALGALAIAGGWWLQRPDPVMQELMQVDVLSQLTAGQL